MENGLMVHTVIDSQTQASRYHYIVDYARD